MDEFWYDTGWEDAERGTFEHAEVDFDEESADLDWLDYRAGYDDYLESVR